MFKIFKPKQPIVKRKNMFHFWKVDQQIKYIDKNRLPLKTI